MKIAVIGSRDIKTFDLTKVIPSDTTQIISGGAIGVDTLASEYATKHGIDIVVYLPNYAQYGKSAPIIRNKQIVENSDCVLAIWNGNSRGTKFTIDYAKKLSKKVILIVVDTSKTNNIALRQ